VFDYSIGNPSQKDILSNQRAAVKLICTISGAKRLPVAILWVFGG